MKSLFWFIYLFLFPVAMLGQPVDTAEKSLRQRHEMVKEYGITDEQAGLIQKLSFVRTKQIDSLHRLGLSHDQVSELRDSITRSYYIQIGKILTPHQREKYDPEVFMTMKTNEIVRLHLPLETRLKLGRAKCDYEKQKKEIIEASDVKGKERRVKLEALEQSYDEAVKRILPSDKYVSWRRFRDGAFERRLRNRYNFSNLQIKQYKDIENKASISIYQLKHSSLSVPERRIKMEAIEKNKIYAIKSILSDEQFNEWYKDYTKRHADAD